MFVSTRFLIDFLVDQCRSLFNLCGRGPRRMVLLGNDLSDSVSFFLLQDKMDVKYIMSLCSCVFVSKSALAK